MNCPENPQSDSDYQYVFRAWLIVDLSGLLLLAIIAVIGLIVVFICTKRELRPRFVTMIWVFIVATILSIAAEMAMVLLTNQIDYKKHPDKYNKYYRIVDSFEGLIQCFYSISHWIFAIEYFNLAI